MELIEYIEISIRTQLTYMIAHDYPDLGYRDPNNFVNEEKHQRLLEILDNELNKSNELFVKHHRENRNGIFPVWVALEMATFSNLVELYKNLKLMIRSSYPVSTIYTIQYLKIGLSF